MVISVLAETFKNCCRMLHKCCSGVVPTAADAAVAAPLLLLPLLFPFPLLQMLLLPRLPLLRDVCVSVAAVAVLLPYG